MKDPTWLTDTPYGAKRAVPVVALAVAIALLVPAAAANPNSSPRSDTNSDPSSVGSFQGTSKLTTVRASGPASHRAATADQSIAITANAISDGSATDPTTARMIDHNAFAFDDFAADRRSAQAVPDGGEALLLLGSALVALFACRRQFHSPLNRMVSRVPWNSLQTPIPSRLPDQVAPLVRPGRDRHLVPDWKRGIDLICCLLALPLLAALTLAMTILTKLVAPGPVFFRQERVGAMGRRYRIFKFRTMHVGSDTACHENYVKEIIGSNAPMSKLDSRGDARLIPGSRLLRASGLDELPQILNVLRGEMTVTGPRPCLPAEYAEYQPWQRRRCEATPGLTGLWQVSGKNRTTFEEMVRLDLRYIETKSCWLDIKIILMTVPALMIQICDTWIARDRSGPSVHSAPPFAKLPAPAPSAGAFLPPTA